MILVQHKKSTYPNSNQKLIRDVNFSNKKPEKFIKYLNKTKIPFADCWFFSVKRELILKNNISVVYKTNIANYEYNFHYIDSYRNCYEKKIILKQLIEYDLRNCN